MEVGMKERMVFEATELRLGLPGNNNIGGGGRSDREGAKKRGFSETEHDETDENESSINPIVNLKLNLSSSSSSSKKEELTPKSTDPAEKLKINLHKETTTLLTADPTKPPAKAQVVGWPPVRSFRKNMLTAGVKKRGSDDSETAWKVAVSGGGSASFVKVSMDGAPFLRKVDLIMYNSYRQLSDALTKMFTSFTTAGNYGSQGMKETMKEGKLTVLLNGCDYVSTYEDKDGDWMLVGDVPWEMFVESCKRLRIIKGKEAIWARTESIGEMQE